MFLKFFLKTYFNRDGKIKKSQIKRAFNDLAPVVSAINPVAGIALGGLGGGKEGLKQSLTGALVGNVLTGNNIFNLSASGKITGAKDLIMKTLNQPNKILMNTLTSGGNLEQGLLKSVMQSGNVPKELQMAITKDFGGIMLSDLLQGQQGASLKDPLVMAMLYEAYKTEPPKPPTLPELQKINDDEVYKRMDMFKQELDEATQKRIDIAQTRFASRGIRGGIVDEEIRLIYKDRDFQIQKAEMDLKDQQLKYNNAIQTERYAMQTNNYQLQQQAQKEKMEALTSTVALMQSRGQNLSEDLLGSFRNTITGIGQSLGLIKTVNNQPFFEDKNTGALVDIDTGIFGNQYSGNEWQSNFNQQPVRDMGLNFKFENTEI